MLTTYKMEANDKVSSIFVYDSVAGPYTLKLDSDYSSTGTISLDSSIYGADGLRTIYVVFNCSEDCEFVYID